MASENERNVVCDAYDYYFYLIVNQGWTPRSAATAACDKFFDRGCRRAGNFIPPATRKAFIAALELINHGDTILCWCHPRRCHCETIRDFINRKFDISKEMAQ